MKKLLFVALMAVAASTAFAGDSDALKAILKAKTYPEAESLLKANLNSLADAAEKAKAYNKLVDLAFDKVNKEQQVQIGNATAQQLGQGKVEPFDTLGFYQALGQAYAAASECDKFDNMPNEKGKVKPKFHKANQDRLYGLRTHLINGGSYYQDQGNQAGTYKCWAMYVDTAFDPLFAEQDKSKDEYLTNIAYYAALMAYGQQDYAGVDKYADIALSDPEKAKDAMNLKLAVAQQNLKTQADSLNYVNKLEEIYARDKNNDLVFGTLVGMYSGLNLKDKMDKVLDEKLTTDPDNFTVWAIRGQNAMIAQNLEEAVTDFKHALVQKPDNTQILTYLGACLYDRASAAEDRAAGKTGRIAPAAMEQIMPIYNESKEYLEKARQLDPSNESKWAYPLYRCYYKIYGADDARTKEAEALTQ